MSTKATGNKKHLTLADRAAIEHGISCGENFTQIAHRINKDSSTISKEIRRHLFRVPHFQNETQRKRSECEHYQNCEKQHPVSVSIILSATSPSFSPLRTFRTSSGYASLPESSSSSSLSFVVKLPCTAE